MKKFFLLSFSIIMFVVVQSQVKPGTASKPVAAKKPATAVKPVSTLKNSLDSMSYAIGMLDGNFFKMQGITQVNAQLLGKGFDDMLKGSPMMTPEQADQLIRREMQKMMRKKNQAVIDEGTKFMAENAKKPGIKQTANGIQYEVIKEGTGPKPQSETSVVKVHYDGTLLNGTKFDSSRDRGQPYQTALTDVIRGWTEILLLMPQGSRYKVWIPYQLGYGDQGSGAIPGGAALVFDMELVEIVKQ
jgi:FKBP-type peptidyl-prolyl cis-trans isomerase